MPFCFFFYHFGINPPPQPVPLYPMRAITHFSFSSLEISIYFCLVYYLHIAHNLCLLISRAVLYLHSLPASCPIFLLSAPFISLSASQRLLITTLFILSLSPHPSSLKTLHSFHPPLLLPCPFFLFFHSFILNSKQVLETNSGRCKSVFNRGQAYISPFSTIHTLSICSQPPQPPPQFWQHTEPHGCKLDSQLKEVMVLCCCSVLWKAQHPEQQVMGFS